MPLSLPRLSRYLKRDEHRNPKIANGSPLGSTYDSSLLNPVLGKSADVKSSSRKARHKRHNHEDGRIDREYDVVLVPSDGVCFSESESDDSDYSVGWLEPHGPGFDSDDGKDNSFAVLVRCYGQSQHNATEDQNNKVPRVVVTVPGNDPAESKKYMEQFLSSLRTV